MDQGGIFAVDLSTHTGWAYGGLNAPRPISGTWVLAGGLNDLGRCYASLQNELEDAFALHRPSLLVFAVPLSKKQTTARLLLGLAAHAESQAYRDRVRCREVVEGSVRKAILGRGGWRKSDDGSASDQAKAAVMAWCRGKGWPFVDHNAADACVVWEFARRFQLSRKQWGDGDG